MTSQDSTRRGVLQSLAHLVLVALPIAVTLFSWITVKAELSYTDGPGVALYGFPMFWHRWSSASSLAYVADPVALMVNLVCYLAAVVALLSLGGRWLRWRPGIGALLTAWIVAGTSVFLVSGQYLLGGSSWSRIAVDGDIASYSLHIGPYYPY